MGSKLRALIYFFVFLLAGWTGYILIFGHGGIVERKKMAGKLHRLDAEIRELEKEKELIDWKIRRLKENRKYIEGYAHELGYKKEGEIIFRFLEREERKKFIDN